MIAFVMFGLLGGVEGVTLSHLWSKLQPPGWLTTSVQLGCAIAIAVMISWGFRKLDELEAEWKKWQRGDDGETMVGKFLASLPDDFYVINDVKVPGQKANLDHVVIGPTGVFVLDAKNWRGLVQADGAGELLLNGRPTDKHYISQYVGRIMGVKERICFQVSTTAYFQGLFVFTAASVDAGWGKTGYVHCMREDQILNYIVENTRGNRLKREEVEKIAQAFLRLAQMDTDFTDKASQVLAHKSMVGEDVVPAQLANK